MAGDSAKQLLFGKDGISEPTGWGEGLFPTDGVPRTTVSLPGAQLHHSVPIKSSFLDERLCQAGPDASETCNYSWLPTPTALHLCQFKAPAGHVLPPASSESGGGHHWKSKLMLLTSSKMQKQNKKFKLTNLNPFPHRALPKETNKH